jgi:hypothetical protein
VIHSIAHAALAGKSSGFLPLAKEPVKQRIRVECRLTRILFPADDSASCHIQVGAVSYISEMREADI